MHRRNKKLSRLLALLLSLAMVLSLVPGIAMAEDAEDIEEQPAVSAADASDVGTTDQESVQTLATVSGQCGDAVTWEYDDETNTLTISGEGAMDDYANSSSNRAPWYNDYRTSIKTVVISDGVTRIGEYAFYSCGAMTKYEIPDSVTSLGAGCFRGCSSLTNVVLNNNISSLETYTFYMCTSLKSVEIPDNITSIGTYCFYDCYALKSVDLGNGVQSLGNYCLAGSNNLAEIVIPDCVTSVGNYAFLNDTALKNIIIGEGVTDISKGAFYNCYAMENVTIGSKVTTIGENAFMDEKKGQTSDQITITFKGSAPTLEGDIFTNKSGLTIYYPCDDGSWTDIAGDSTYGGATSIDAWYANHSLSEEATWSWSEDYSSATAARVCSICKESVTADAVVSSETTVEPTITDPGEAVYTAVADFYDGAEYTDKVTVVLPSLCDHVWGVAVFTWSDDYESATATRTCTVCGTTETVDAEVSIEVVTEPECEKTGMAVYTAVAVFDDDAEYTDSKTADIPALGHEWSNPVFDWSEDYSSATAIRICERCEETETVSAEVTYEVTVKPTDTESGEGVYTAKATFDDGTVTTSDPVTVTIPALDVDKTGLDDEIADAEKLNQDDYTEESWAELQKALENAEAVTSDPYASQEDVDAAAAAVKEAISNLVKASDTPTPEAKNGFVQENGEWHYYDNGTRFTGSDIKQDTKKAIDGTDGWYYIENGKVNFDYTRVSNFSNAYGWWYVKNGKVDFSKTGIEQNNYGWWRIVGGKVDFSCNSVEQNDYGWWYLVGGQVRFDYTGVADYANAYGWWYISGGQVDFSKTGIEPNSYGWWRVVNGQVDFSCNSVEQNDYGWWYVTGGQVQFGYTGVANYANAYGWWYIRDGKVDFSYTGTASNNYGTWNVVNGKVVF